MSGRKLIRRGSGVLAAVAALATAAVVLPLPGRTTEVARSAPADPDPGFAGGGAATAAFGGALSTTGDAVGANADGSVMVAGTIDVASGGTGGGDLAIARLTANGALDTTYGASGIRIVDAGTGERVSDLATAGDRATVVVGWRTSAGSGNDVLVVRLTAAGVPDPAFGSAGTPGVAVVDLGGDDRGRAVGLDPAGRPVILATSGGNTVVLRLTTTGALDPSFHFDGLAGLPAGMTPANGSGALAVAPDGTVGVVGTGSGLSADGQARPSMAMGRLTSAGAPDPGFGSGGVVSVDLFGFRSGTGLAIGARPDSGFWLAGTTTNDFAPGATQLLLSQVTQSGQASRYFGENGGGFGSLGGGESIHAVMPAGVGNGVIVAVRSGNRFVLYKRSESGDAVFNFGSNGIATVDVGDSRAIAMMADGRMVASGRLPNAAAVVRLTTSGALDSAFGSGGLALVAVSVDVDATASAIGVHPDGDLTVAGDLVGPSGGVALLRLGSNGAPDPTFGSGGRLVLSPFATWQPYAGRIVGGLVAFPSGFVLLGAGPELVRLNPDGSYDQTFGRRGRFVVCSECRVTGVTVTPDNRYVATALTDTGAVVVVRVLPDGSLDESFARGTVQLPGTFVGAPSVASSPDGRLVVAAPPASPAGTVAVTRLSTDGSADPSFGGGSLVRIDLPVAGEKQVAGVVARADGAVDVVSRAASRLLVTRLTPAGAPNPAVGPGGTALTEVPGLTALGRLDVTGDGRIVVAATIGGSGAVLRIGLDGRVDPGFAGGALAITGIGTAAADATVDGAGQVTVVGSAPIPGAGRGLVVRRFKGDRPDTSLYHPLTPARLLDTRTGLGGRAAPLGPNGTLDLLVLGQGGVPSSGVAAVALSVVATNATATTYLTAYPSGAAAPLASNLNLAAGQTVNNLTIAKLGANGAVRFVNANGNVDVVVDVVGWYDEIGRSDGRQFTSLEPARILDTRSGLGQGGRAAAVGPASTIDLKVTDVGGVPQLGVTAVAINLTVTSPTALSHLTVFPAGEAPPLASNVNFAPGSTVSRLVLAKVGDGGRISIRNANGNVHVIADVVGWFDDSGSNPTSRFTSLPPIRVLDTRTATGGANGPMGAGAQLKLQIAGRGGVPVSGARAVVLNLTATDSSANAYLSVFPSGSPVPNASTLNTTFGQTVSNLVIGRLGPDGSVTILHSFGTTHVIADVVGWYS